MPAILLKILAATPCWARAALAVLAAAGAAAAYDRLIDDPAVRRAALAGYVARVELDAAEARAAEAERQRKAADAALADFSERLRQAEAAAFAAREAMEQAIADYEAKAKSAGSDLPRFTDDDIRFLTR